MELGFEPVEDVVAAVVLACWGGAPEGAAPVLSAYSSGKQGATCLLMGGRWFYSFNGAVVSSRGYLGEKVDARSLALAASGDVLLGARDGRVLVFDREVNLIHELDGETGLIDTTLVDLEEDLFGRFWVVQEQGVLVTQLSEPILLYGA